MRADHGDHVAAQLADLAHQGAADALQVGCGQQKHGFYLRAQLAVHGGHLRFVVKVGHIAHAAHHGAGRMLGAKVHDQAIEWQDFDMRHAFHSRLRHVYALLQAKQRLFMVCHSHRHDQRVKQARSTADHVFVAEGDGVKCAGVDGGTGHGRNDTRLGCFSALGRRNGRMASGALRPGCALGVAEALLFTY
jgi:hypothetical protein